MTGPVAAAAPAVAHSLWRTAGLPPTGPGTAAFDASHGIAGIADLAADSPSAGAAVHGVPAPGVGAVLLTVALVTVCLVLRASARWTRPVRRRSALLFSQQPPPVGHGVAPAQRVRPPLIPTARAAGRLRERRDAGRARPALAALAAGTVLALALGGPHGVLAGAAAAALVWRWARGWIPRAALAAEEAARERETAAQLPMAAELLAACLAAGAAPAEAATAVGRSLAGPLGARLNRVGAELRLGAETAAAWAHLSESPAGRGLARCLERSQLSGTPAVEQLARCAADARAAAARAAASRARRAGVLVTAPLGLCFLPAFLLVGVVPVVIGLGRALL
ncbi:type II secretion system F family protein [Streptomyces durbertensis]|uniref:Type II secretion system F family protein n=1 Tax=Streptomyces durbertensis TaxID=2448886 RepID=A0ABR6EDA0_9ACTN|nr:type II secretion system F family protein [Streptomyces durbertensis]MBB1243032.1 type II secretion system F family protein [Streptomyces durbertensis]